MGRIKAISKKQKIMLAPTGAFADSDEEAAKSVHEGTASVAASVEDHCSNAFTAHEDEGFVGAALKGMGGDEGAESSDVQPLPALLGNESSRSKDDDTGVGRASAAGSEVAGNEGCRRSKKAPIVEEFEDESEGHSLPA